MMATVFAKKRASFWKISMNVSQQFSCETFIKLRCTMQNRHDNARPRTAALIIKKIQDFRWKLFNHSPHSLDYSLFLRLKQLLSGQRLENGEEIKAAVVNLFNFKAVN